MYPRVLHDLVSLATGLPAVSMLKTLFFFFFPPFLRPSSCIRPSGATWRTVNYFHSLYLLIKIDTFFYVAVFSPETWSTFLLRDFVLTVTDVHRG